MKNTLQHRDCVSTIGRTAKSAALALAVLLVLAVVTATNQPAQAQTFTTVHSFDGTDGSYVDAPLAQATDGNLYGATRLGGANGDGTFFNITMGGTLNLLYSFCSQPGCSDGSEPVAGLVQATNGDLYGTTITGGNGNGTNWGTIFSYALSSATLTTIDDFCVATSTPPFLNCNNGSAPYAGLVQASNGDLYGTTTSGGSFGPCCPGYGTIFKITETGKLKQLHVFCASPSGEGNCDNSNNVSDGWGPTGGLVQATNGVLYGTTCCGGNANDGGGTVFKITEGGAFTNLYDFCSQPNCTDGDNNNGPGNGYQSTLVQATNGNLYGITQNGGANGAGVVFEITPAGQFTTLYSFCSQPACADGSNPIGWLIQGTDGNLYGTTSAGGNYYYGPSGFCYASYGCGTVFQITPSGTLTTLYSFCLQSGCADGTNPQAALVQGTNGAFYGTTQWGGVNYCSQDGGSCGTVFSLSTGLGPFVKTVPASGKLGGTITILGTNLTGATSVTFNGLAAAFTPVSSSEITATVPAADGAINASGYVTVTTPSGTLTSNVPFLLGTTLTTTTATITSSPNPSTSGQAVTFTATVSANAGTPPNGETVSFVKGTTVLGTGTLNNGTATFTTSTLPVGTTSVKAEYAADAYFKKSTSNTVRQVVDHAAN